ncbi:MAG: DNA translocase FtsK [Ruminococcus sp.]|nr:DNA translocase FtsK [Ruminococcus sp.]
MAETKKKTTQTKKTGSKTAAAKKTASGGSRAKPAASDNTEAKFRERRRFWSLILFFFGIFETLLAFIKGDGLWAVLYEFNRGMMGASVFVFGIFIIYMALTIAGEKSKNAVIAQALQGIVMFFLLSGASQIFFGGKIGSGSFKDVIADLYDEGTELRGGGVSGGIVGRTLQTYFGQTGAAIIIVMLILLFALLLSDVTLPQLLGWITKPVVGGAKALKEDRAEHIYEREQREQEMPHYTEPAPAPAPRRERGSRTFKKRSVDFAKVHQAQLEKLRLEEEAAKERAAEFEKGADIMIGKPVEQADEWAQTPNVEDTAPEKSESAEEEKKPASKKAERAKQVNEEKQKLADQIRLNELIRKAAGEPARPKPVLIEPDGQTTLFGSDGAEKADTYVFPPVELLKESKRTSSEEEIQREIQDKSTKLVETLETFGVKTRIIGIHRGPAVTRYELQPAAGVKVKQVTSLADDIALNLAADSVRIEAPIPGKPAIGIEIPNIHRDSVSMRELIDSDDYRRAKGKLSFAVGKDIEGNIVIGNIASMPHMLIAGTTGSGKSVFTNSIILNILFHASPDEVKLILIDPKKVEFPMYNGIPHLLIPVVTEPLKAAGALGWAVNEMMRRYKLFEANGTKNLEDYNEMVAEMIANDPDCERTPLPQIVIVVDEFADLMLAAKNEVEESVMRLAQLARAAGMHMLIATQSPRVDVLTGLIKANIPSRTALMVSNNTDSRVILDEVGAEKLLGKGDMLYKPVGFPKPMRIQSGFASTAEIREIVSFLKNEHGSSYDQEVVHEVEQNMPKPKDDDGADISINPDDDLVNQAITIIVETGNASTAFLQRKLKLGFPRAARIMDDIEAMGIIGPQEGAKPRKILLTKEEWYERQGKE